MRKAFDTAMSSEANSRAVTEKDIHRLLDTGLIITSEIGLGRTSIICLMLHRAIESGTLRLEQIKTVFGEKVAQILAGLRDISHIYATHRVVDSENFRKLLLSFAEDVRVQLIFLAEKLYDLRHAETLLPEQQRELARETSYIYIPFAHRLGLYNIKSEMEDLALRYGEPEVYKEISLKLEGTREAREKYINEFIAPIVEEFNNRGIKFKVKWRTKTIASILNKMRKKQVEFEEIYDIFAVRFILDSRGPEEKADCWRAYSIVADKYTPNPQRLRDWISVPKSNGYESLQTTVLGPNNRWVEVQIRTERMDEIAEKGFAAHWKYKAGISGNVSGEKRFDWIRQLLERQQEADDVEAIADAIKTDLSPDEVFVFTPKGDVVALPTGATVLDFAYHIHTQVGNKMTGAKVGGRMVSFDYVVHTGEIVEILTSGSPNYGPNRNWIEIAKTTEAKSKIRSWFKKECREENIERGREELEREFKRNNIAITPELLQTSASRQRLDSVDDLYAAIGYGGVSMAKIVQRIKEDQLRNHKEQQAIQAAAENPMESISENNRRSRKKGIIIEGMENCLVKFAQCCNPLPGDPIIGFVTRGFGVSIHKQDCVNVVNNRDDPDNKDRWLKATWAGVEDSTYRATIDVIAEDRITIFADITTAIAANHIPLQEMNGHHLKNGNLDLVVTVEIAGVEQLSNVMGRIQKIPGVISVERTGKQ